MSWWSNVRDAVLDSSGASGVYKSIQDVGRKEAPVPITQSGLLPSQDGVAFGTAILVVIGIWLVMEKIK